MSDSVTNDFLWVRNLMSRRHRYRRLAAPGGGPPPHRSTLSQAAWTNGAKKTWSLAKPIGA